MKTLPFPRLLIHERESLPRDRHGSGRNALNNIFGIWKTARTSPATMEQEKIEVYWKWMSLLLSTVAAFASPILSVLILLIYPGAYWIKWPGSVHVRRYFEIRSHARELQYRLDDQDETDPLLREAFKNAITGSESFTMAKSKSYDLKLDAFEIRRRLLRRLK